MCWTYSLLQQFRWRVDISYWAYWLWFMQYILMYWCAAEEITKRSGIIEEKLEYSKLIWRKQVMTRPKNKWEASSTNFLERGRSHIAWWQYTVWDSIWATHSVRTPNKICNTIIFFIRLDDFVTSWSEDCSCYKCERDALKLANDVDSLPWCTVENVLTIHCNAA